MKQNLHIMTFAQNILLLVNILVSICFLQYYVSNALNIPGQPLVAQFPLKIW